MVNDLRIQTFLSYLENNGNLKRLTTNLDNIRSPIHRWFPFLAGFSHKLVEESIKYFKMIDNESIVFDPFMGSGTTGVVGKELGVNVIGNESNTFLYEICKLKTDFNVNPKEIRLFAKELVDKASIKWKRIGIKSEHPLLQKCYPENNLKKLISLRELIESDTNIDNKYKQYLFLATTMSLTQSAFVGINVPYVSWTHKRKPEEVFSLLEKNVFKIEEDLNKALTSYKNNTEIKVYLHDTRKNNNRIKNKSVDMIFTSPPYLNNFDYGESLKVFLYFWKIAENWGEITEKIRKRAIASSTTHYSEYKYVGKKPEDIMGSRLMNKASYVAQEIINKIYQISSQKERKNSKKSFDILTALYFKDMFSSLNEMFRVMRKETLAFIVIGDSAPYGIHVPTDMFLGEMAVELGFSSYTLKPLRIRGTKWRTLKYRHKKKLRESLLILRK